MKTTYVMSEESVKNLKALINDAENNTMERTFVLNQVRKVIKKSDAEVAVAIENNWKRYGELQALRMPHVIYNGDKTPTIVDWVKYTDSFKLAKAIKSYRYTGEETTSVEGCTNGVIVRSIKSTKKETVKLASGFEIEVPSRDAEGAIIEESVEQKFCPKAKSKWGFTAVFVEACIDAADDLMAELAEAEAKKSAK